MDVLVVVLFDDFLVDVVGCLVGGSGDVEGEYGVGDCVGFGE